MGLEILPWSPTSLEEPVGFIPDIRAVDIEVDPERSLAYVFTETELVVVDIRDPTAPTVLRTHHHTDWVLRSYLTDTRVVAVSYLDGIAVYERE